MHHLKSPKLRYIRKFIQLCRGQLRLSAGDQLLVGGVGSLARDAARVSPSVRAGVALVRGQSNLSLMKLAIQQQQLGFFVFKIYNYF